MRTHPSLLLVALLILGMAAPLVSQENDETAQALAKALLGRRQDNLTDPSLVSPASRPPQFQGIVSATRDKTQVAVEIGFKSLETSTSEIFSGIKVTGPIGEKDSEAQLATLEGLANQATVSYKLGILTPLPERLIANVIARGGNDELLKMLNRAHRLDDPNAKDLDEISTNDLSEGARRIFLRDLGLGTGIKLLSLEASYAAPKDFKYVTSALEEKQERHDGYSVALSGGVLPLRRGFYFLGLTYRHEASYQDRSKQQICKPLGTGGALQCSNLVIGAPSKQEKNLGQVEMRKYFREGTFAINPRYSYDFDSEVSGAELPFYFLRDEKGTLNGGISVGWRSDTKEYVVSAFVGSMRNPFGR